MRPQDGMANSLDPDKVYKIKFTSCMAVIDDRYWRQL